MITAFKKFILSFLVFILCLMLSSCTLPFVDKLTWQTSEKEKTPDEIMRLMYEEMNKSVSMEYEATVLIDVYSKEDKVSFKPNTKIINRQEKFFGDGPIVLGIDNASSTENDLNTLFKPNIDSLLASHKNIKIELILKGKAVKGLDDKFKTHTNININYDVEEVMLRSKAEIITINDIAYVKADELPMSLLFAKGKEFVNQWYYIDPKETLSFLDEAARESYEKNEKNDPMLFQKEIIKIIKEIIGLGIDKQLWKVAEPLGDEKLNERNHFHYRTALNTDNWSAFIGEFYNSYTKAFNKKNPVIFINPENNPDLFEYINTFSQAVNLTNGEIWIDQENNQKSRSKFNLTIDTSKLKLFEIKNSDKNPNVRASIDIKYFNINGPINIEKPSKAISLIKTIDETIIIPSRKAIRAFRRLNDINQIQTALELYHLDAGKYPKKLIFGEELSYNKNIYIGKLPTNPLPNDGKCEKDFAYSYQASEDRQSYKLNYCLGEPLPGIPAGYQTATPKGLYQYEKFSDTSLRNIFKNIYYAVETTDKTYYGMILDLNTDPLVLTNVYCLEYVPESRRIDPRYSDMALAKTMSDDMSGNDINYMPLSSVVNVKPLTHNNKIFRSILNKELTTNPESELADTGNPYNDTDKDNLNNLAEEFYGTDPKKSDTDGDTYSDGDEVAAGFNPNGPGKLEAHLAKAYQAIQAENKDLDGDGLDNIAEIIHNTDPNKYDTDDDGESDLSEFKYQKSNFFNQQNNDAEANQKKELETDSDEDGIPDAMERIIGSDPKIADTDADGYNDGDEVAAGFNPVGEGKVIPVNDDDIILFSEQNCKYCHKINDWLIENKAKETINFSVLDVTSSLINHYYFEKKFKSCGYETILLPAVWDGPNSNCLHGYFIIMNFFKKKLGINEE